MSDLKNDFMDLSLSNNAPGGAHGGDAQFSGVTNENVKPTGADEIAARAEKAGWVKPTEFDYKKLADNQGQSTGVGPAPAVIDSAEESAWGATAVRYEWRDEYGDVAPKDEVLEKQLFEDQFLARRGEFLGNLKSIEVTIESENKIKPVKQFKDAGLHPVMLENVGLCKYADPMPIQAYCIPAILSNQDVIAVAQTGSGKTAAYMIPVLSKLMGKAKKLQAPRAVLRAEPLVLVLVPTRELAVQIFDEARRLCYRSMLRPCVAYGGGPTKDQANELRKGCDILIGTPGRLLDFVQRGSLLSLRRLRYTILDEADELVSDDWSEDIKAIMAGSDNNEDADHRYLMFSATFPRGARLLAREYLDEGHIRIRIGRLGSTHKNIAQKIVYCTDEQKKKCLSDLLLSMPPARTIVFVNNKRTTDFVDDYLYNSGLPSTSIHSDRTQREREDAIRAFRSGKAPILVTTGVSARGLDIANVMHVINYDLPSMDHGGIHEYTHRIGRTARIGQAGLASSLYNEQNEDIAPLLTKTLFEMGQDIPEFLQAFKPDENGEKIDFEDDSDADEATKANHDGWGENNAVEVGPSAKIDTTASNAPSAPEEPMGW